MFAWDIVNERVVILNYHHRASAKLVDEPPYYVPERTKNKLYLALVFMILLIYVIHIVVTPLGQRPQSVDLEPTHHITIWTEPVNYTCTLEFEFYNSPQDAMTESNRLAHAAPEIQRNEAKRDDVYLYTLPQAPNRFWVRIGYTNLTNGEPVEWVYDIYALIIGEHLSIHLGGRDFTILVTRAQNE